MLLCPALFGIVGHSDVLTSFESESDLLAIDHAGVVIERSPQHYTDGRFSLKATFKEGEWPHLLWSPAQPLDWSKHGGLAADVYNPNDKAVELGIRIDDDRSADGMRHCRTATVILEPRKQQSIAIGLGIDPMQVGMRALPPVAVDRMVTAGGDINMATNHVVAYQFFMHKPEPATTLYFDNLRSISSVTSAPLDGIVDRFGQFAHATWPGKLTRETEFPSLIAAESADLTKHSSLAGRDRFGGWDTGPSLKATRFFRTEKVEGKWWLVDPLGKLFFSMGIDVVEPWEKTMITGRERMFEELPALGDPLSQFFSNESGIHMGPVKEGRAYDFYQANLYRKFGQSYLQAWHDEALKRLPSWGFNTIGNWSDQSLYRNGRLPFVATGGVYGNHATVSSGSDYWGRMPDPFDPQFAIDARDCLKPLIAKVLDDPWCLGYFVDNELSWAGNGVDGRYGLAIGALSEPSTSPARRAFMERIRSTYGDLSSVNSAWGVHADSWESLRLPEPLNDFSRKDAGLFTKEFARRYFRVIRDVLHEGDPEHLYLGCRFAWRTPEAEEASAEFCDVVSFNIYSPKLDDSWKSVERLDRPCIIGEFHFGALDRGMFHPGLVSTPNQAARAAMYEDYVGSVLASPAFVGCHWFQYVDEPLTGRSFDGENYNIGFVSVADIPYPEMVAAARRVHSDAYRLRLRKGK